MAEHGDAAEQIDEQTPPEEGTVVDEHDTDADLTENAEMPAPQRFSDTRALITVGSVILAALAVWGAGSDTVSTRTARRKRSAIYRLADMGATAGCHVCGSRSGHPLEIGAQ